eukprot:8619_1
MATSDWSQLYDRYYRKRLVYDMAWRDIDLEKYIVVGATCGGPVAMIRDDRKILLLGKGLRKSHPEMKIFSSSGQLISIFAWKSKTLVKMGWTREEHLVCVLEDGTLMRYSIQGELLSSFRIGQDLHIAECHFWEGGLVIRTSGKVELWAVNEFSESKVERLKDPALDRPPASMVVLSPETSGTDRVAVLLSTAEGTVLRVDKRDVEDLMVESGPFTAMSVCPGANLVACFTTNGKLLVESLNFRKHLSEFNTESPVAPYD